jgi:hypothetical protein
MKSNLQIRSLYKYQCLFKRTRANNSQLVRRHKKQSHLEKMLKTSQCLYQTIGHKNNCQKKKKTSMEAWCHDSMCESTYIKFPEPTYTPAWCAASLVISACRRRRDRQWKLFSKQALGSRDTWTLSKYIMWKWMDKIPSKPGICVCSHKHMWKHIHSCIHTTYWKWHGNVIKTDI